MPPVPGPVVLAGVAGLGAGVAVLVGLLRRSVTADSSSLAVKRSGRFDP